MCSPEYPCHIKKKKIRFSYTFSLGDSIPELQVIKLLITELKGKKKKDLKEYAEGLMLLGSVSGNMMDLPSVADVHMNTGLCFKMRQNRGT